MRRRIQYHARRAKYIVYQETLVDYREHLWTFIGSFFGIGLIGLLSSRYFTASDNLFLIGSFGRILCFNLRRDKQPAGPAAQPHWWASCLRTYRCYRTQTDTPRSVAHCRIFSFACYSSHADDKNTSPAGRRNRIDC